MHAGGEDAGGCGVDVAARRGGIDGADCRAEGGRQQERGKKEQHGCGTTEEWTRDAPRGS